jgi:hypothetical protein
MKVWEPATGAVVARGPVVTWASRSRPRIASSIAFAALARTALPHVLPTLRLAVHPGDCGVPALLASIDSTLRRFLRTHRASRYDRSPPRQRRWPRDAPPAASAADRSSGRKVCRPRRGSILLPARHRVAAMLFLSRFSR